MRQFPQVTAVTTDGRPARGAVLMITGGIAELILGVEAERRSLEDIARPRTAAGRSSGQPQGQLRTAT